MTRKTVDVAVIIPGASPILTLAWINRIDLLASFAVPLKLVDQVHHEVTKQENDPNGGIAAALLRLHDQLEIIETNAGTGYQTRATQNPRVP